jgi:hypothetical protein
MSKIFIAILLACFLVSAHAIDWSGIAIGAGQQTQYQQAQEARKAELEAIRARTEYQNLQTQQLKQQQEDEEQRVLRARHEEILRQREEQQAAQSLIRQQREQQAQLQQARIDLERKQQEQSLIPKPSPDRIYRCGSDYVNASAGEEAKYSNCKLISGGRTIEAPPPKSKRNLSKKELDKYHACLVDATKAPTTIGVKWGSDLCDSKFGQ